MSEEEILNKLRKMLYYTQKANECGLSNNDFKEHIEALEGILDLYNKEKAKNKILELAKIPYLEGEIMAYKEFFVSKDKIREQIKQIKSEEANIYFKEHVVYFLQELLEEE
jgi:hypothetical protein